MEINEGKPKVTEQSYGQIKSTLSEAKDLKNKKSTLLEEKQTILRDIQSIGNELEGVNVAIEKTREQIKSTMNRAKIHQSTADSLKLRSDELTAEINSLQKNIKQVNEDIQNCKVLRKHLEREKDVFETERNVLIKSIDYMETGIEKISRRKEVILPHLVKYDELLKSLYRSFKEIELRMGVTLQVSNKLEL